MGGSKVDTVGILARCDEDERICREATPGPWYVAAYGEAIYSEADDSRMVASTKDGDYILDDDGKTEWEMMWCNADLIAHARTALEQAVTDRRLLVEHMRQLTARGGWNDDDAYIAVCPGCGAILGATLRFSSVELAQTLAGWARYGYDIRRASAEYVRSAEWTCSCEKAKQLEMELKEGE